MWHTVAADWWLLTCRRRCWCECVDSCRNQRSSPYPHPHPLIRCSCYTGRRETCSVDAVCSSVMPQRAGGSQAKQHATLSAAPSRYARDCDEEMRLPCCRRLDGRQAGAERNAHQCLFCDIFGSYILAVTARNVWHIWGLFLFLPCPFVVSCWHERWFSVRRHL